MTQHIEKTRLFMAVSAFGGAIILAAEGENAAAEITEMSANPAEWASLEEDIPHAPGLYVWEGEAIVEDGVGAGELGGQGDCDFTWAGACRPATLTDLLAFNYHHGSPTCPRHKVTRPKIVGGGGNYCPICEAEAKEAKAKRDEGGD